MRRFIAFSFLGLIALAGCDPYPATLTPDYTIRVVDKPGGMQAIPPGCPSWVTDDTDPYDNQPVPQFGCANARNLALMTERPSDLVQPRTLGPTRGVTMVGAMRRYDNNQTRGLIYLSPSVDNAVDVTTSSTSASSLTGDVTGGSGTSSSSSAAPSTSTSSSTSSSGTSSGTSSGP